MLIYVLSNQRILNHSVTQHETLYQHVNKQTFVRLRHSCISLGRIKEMYATIEFMSVTHKPHLLLSHWGKSEDWFIFYILISVCSFRPLLITHGTDRDNWFNNQEFLWVDDRFLYSHDLTI